MQSVLAISTLDDEVCNKSILSRLFVLERNYMLWLRDDFLFSVADL